MSLEECSLSVMTEVSKEVLVGTVDGSWTNCALMRHAVHCQHTGKISESEKYADGLLGYSQVHHSQSIQRKCWYMFDPGFEETENVWVV